MLYGGRNGVRLEGVGEDSPYTDWFSGAITDARNVLGLWNQAFPQPVQPTTRYVPVQVPATGGGMFGMDTTTMLMVGAVVVGGLFFMTKR